MLLVIELKTEIVEVSGLLGSMDRRRRLAPKIAARLGWEAVAVSTWVVVADSRRAGRDRAQVERGDRRRDVHRRPISR
jgi:hypothetical protein